MIFTQTSPTTLESRTSGVSALIAGVLLGAVGVIGAPTAFAAKANPYVIGFLALFFVIGIIVLLTARKQVTILTNPGTSTITSTRLIGGKTSTRSFDASQVTGVQLTSRIEQSSNNGSPSNPKRHTMLNLYLADGSKIQLANQIANQNAFTLNGIGANITLPLDEDGRRVAALFGVQYMSQDKSFGDNPVQSIADASRLIHEAMQGARQDTPYEQPATTQPTPVSSAPMQPTSQPTQPVALVQPVPPYVAPQERNGASQDGTYRQ